MEPDPLRAEEAEAVDRRAHHELPGDQDPDCRRDTDPWARVRDREHDQEAEHAAAQHPPGLMNGVGVAGDAAAADDQHREREHRGQQRREAERLQHADPLAETRHDGDLHRAREARSNREDCCERASRHGLTLRHR